MAVNKIRGLEERLSDHTDIMTQKHDRLEGLVQKQTEDVNGQLDKLTNALVLQQQQQADRDAHEQHLQEARERREQAQEERDRLREERERNREISDNNFQMMLLNLMTNQQNGHMGNSQQNAGPTGQYGIPYNGYSGTSFNQPTNMMPMHGQYHPTEDGNNGSMHRPSPYQNNSKDCNMGSPTEQPINYQQQHVVRNLREEDSLEGTSFEIEFEPNDGRPEEQPNEQEINGDQNGFAEESNE